MTAPPTLSRPWGCRNRPLTCCRNDFNGHAGFLKTKLADLLAVAGNRILNITALMGVLVVIHAGNVVFGPTFTGE